MDRRELSEDEFTKFQDFIYVSSGIRVPDAKRSLLSSRIRRRLSVGEFDCFAAYLRHLKSAAGRQEIRNFLNVVTTNETFFFRTEKHFDWFSTQFLEEVVRSSQRGQHSRKLRIWSAACSTGEEVYSLAICLAENQLRLRGWDLKIIGTDISHEVITKAEDGVYGERVMEGVNDKRRRRYFVHLPEQNRWQVRPAIRELVEFRQHNLLQPFERSEFDCILIRNVLIYFDRESKQKVVQNLIRSMAEESWLIVGPSEGIYDMLGDLKKHSTFLYQKTS